MSIQLAIKIPPSRLLFCMSVVMVFLANCSLLLTAMLLTSSIVWLTCMCVVSFAGSGLLLMHQWNAMIAVELHISHDGRVILRRGDQHGKHAAESIKVKLNHKTKIWNRYMFLHFDDEAGKPYSVVVFPDSIANEHFRVLAASLLWIAQHQQSSLKMKNQHGTFKR